MKSLVLTPELETVALKVVWFKSPLEAIAYPYHFIAHVLTYGTYEDVCVLKKQVSADELREAIENAPPGVFDPRSWAYWNLMIGRYPTPPMPKRVIPGVDDD